ncbi:MAG: HD domain-containing protein [Coriobacteriia bacterium]|nr:HD domain-containing protein [Coriobacteriia bacterium]
MRPKPSFSSRLHTQIAVPFIAVSIAMAILTAVAALYLLQDLTQQWSGQIAQTTSQSVALRFDQYSADMGKVAHLLAEDPQTRAAADRGDRATLAAVVASQAVLLPYGSEEVVDAASGNLIAGAGSSSIPGGKLLVGRGGAAGVPASGTILGEDGTLTAYEPLGTTARYRLGLSTHVGDAWLGALTDGATGAFGLFSPTGQRLAITVHEPQTGAERALQDSLSSNDQTVQDALKAAAASGIGEGNVSVLGIDYRLRVIPLGAGSVGGGAPVVYLLSAVSESLTETTARNSVRMVTIGALLAVIALIGLGFWVAQRVSEPLVELAEGAHRIAIGDFSTKVPIRRGTSEIELLGETFNDMTDSLRERSESLTKKVLELATLYEMSRALGSTLDMDELLGSTLDSALRIFDLDVGYVALRDRDAGSLEIRAVRGGEVLGETAGTQAIRSSMAEWVVREGRPLIFNPDPTSESGQVDVVTGAKAALCVPLVSSEGTIGAITVGSSDATYRFNSDDVRLLSTIGNHVTIAVGNIELFSSLQEAYIATVRSLAAAVDAKDTYTRGHSDKVATYAILIAEHLELGHDQLTALEMAAYLHDIGKIGVPESILLKPGQLSDDEMAQMRHHPLIGANILRPVAFPWAITPIVRHHHEFWDGQGYPAGLKGEEIPLLARILCVADSYEAMTADRPYRAGRSAADAIEELHRCSGTQFDPRIVETMTTVIEELERAGSGVLGDMAEEVSAEEARAIFSALVDGVLASFRRLGGPRLASNVEAEVEEYFRAGRLPYRMERGRLMFTEDAKDESPTELDDMRMALRRIDTIIGRVSGGTLVDHFYDDALEGFSARMCHLAVKLDFHGVE